MLYTSRYDSPLGGILLAGGRRGPDRPVVRRAEVFCGYTAGAACGARDAGV